MESIDVKIDEDLPEKEIEEHEVDPLIEEEEPEKEEKYQGKRTISNSFKDETSPKISPRRADYWQYK